MALDIYILDQDWKKLKVIGQVNSDTIKLLTNLAREKKLKYVPYIYFIGNTIFNHKQLPYLKEELELLINVDALPKDDLVIILNAIKNVQNYTSHYLMFIGE